MGNNHAALIIDLRESRSYSPDNRIRIQNYLIEITNFLNTYFSGMIDKDVEFSAGDEMQGLFSTPEGAYLYFRLLSIWIHPIHIRAGIGVGSWDVRIEDSGTTSQDGKAYHRARYAIKNTDANEGYPILIYSNTENDIAINTLMGAASTLMEKISVNQNQLLLLTELLFPIDIRCANKDSFDKNQVQKLLMNKNIFDCANIKIEKKLPLTEVDPFDLPNTEKNKCELDFNTDKNKIQPFFITQGKQRGIPTRIAEVVDMKRQTIDRGLKNSGAYAVRNIALTVLHEMKRSFE